MAGQAVGGEQFQNGPGRYCRKGAGSIRVEIRAKKALATCCGVNLAWDWQKVGGEKEVGGSSGRRKTVSKRFRASW